MKLRKTIVSVSAVAFIFTFLTIPLAASAAFEWWDRRKTSETFGLADKDLDLVVIDVVKWALGLVGLISVIMVIYGGITWMTSAGNEEKVTKAKSILKAAIIGVLVIMLSWAVLFYIVDYLTLNVLN